MNPPFTIPPCVSKLGSTGLSTVCGLMHLASGRKACLVLWDVRFKPRAKSQRGLQALDDLGKRQGGQGFPLPQPLRLLRQAGNVDKASPHLRIVRLDLVQQPAEQGVAHKKPRAQRDITAKGSANSYNLRIRRPFS